METIVLKAPPASTPARFKPHLLNGLVDHPTPPFGLLSCTANAALTIHCFQKFQRSHRRLLATATDGDFMNRPQQNTTVTYLSVNGKVNPKIWLSAISVCSCFTFISSANENGNGAHYQKETGGWRIHSSAGVFLLHTYAAIGWRSSAPFLIMWKKNLLEGVECQYRKLRWWPVKIKSSNCCFSSLVLSTWNESKTISAVWGDTRKPVIRSASDILMYLSTWW